MTTPTWWLPVKPDIIVSDEFADEQIYVPIEEALNWCIESNTGAKPFYGVARAIQDEDGETWHIAPPHPTPGMAWVTEATDTGVIIHDGPRYVADVHALTTDVGGEAAAYAARIAQVPVLERMVSQVHDALAAIDDGNDPDLCLDGIAQAVGYKRQVTA